MKKRMAMLLSLTGVLVAGSAAAVVNTQILSDDGGTGSASAAEATIASDVSTSSVATTIDTSTTINSAPASSVDGASTTTDTVTSTSVPVIAGAPTATQATYQIGESGTVTLDTAGDVLTIVAASPNAGWIVDEAESDGPLAIEVKFRSGSTVVEFEANLLFGVVGTSVEVKTDGVSNSTLGTAPSTSFDDHGGDDGVDNSGSGSDNSGSGSDSSGHGGGDDD